MDNTIKNSTTKQPNYLYLHLLALQKTLCGMDDILAKRFMANCFFEQDRLCKNKKRCTQFSDVSTKKK